MKIRLLLNCAMVLLLVVLSADFGGSPLLNVVATLERQTLDWRLARGADDGVKNQDIVIVDIDRDSLQSVGNWPWPRDKLAEMLDQLFNQYQVRVAAFTFPFTAPDDDGLAIFDQVHGALQSGDSGYNDNYNVNRLRQKFDYDKALISAMHRRSVILGYLFDNSARVAGILPPPMNFNAADGKTKIAALDVLAAGGEWNYYRGYAANLKKIVAVSTAGAGYVNFIEDSDGFVRRAPLVARHAKKDYQSLALAVVRGSDTPGQILPIAVQKDDDYIHTLLTGRYRVPINRAGEMYLNFIGEGGPTADFENSRKAIFRYVSAINVIQGITKTNVLRDKIVIIGSSSEDLRDIYSMPLNSAIPGAELLATQIANIMNDKVLRRLPSTDAWALLLLIGVALLAALVFAVLGPVLSFVLTIILCAAFIYGNLHFWDTHLEVVNFVAPIIVFIGLFLWNSISGFVFEWNASRNLQSTFGQYVPPELAKNMSSQKTVSMEGESRVISVLFSDVRNFTSISETFTPQDLTKMMNRMLTALSGAIHEHGGTVDKFIGDAVMAFWNAPLDDEEHAKHSVASALAMQEAMRQLSNELESEGRPPMRLGVGICSGEANVGNMGSKLRMAYTAMGDTVNVASRVEGLTKYYKIGILVTASTHEMCADSGIFFRMVDSVRVKGRLQALNIYEPMGSEHLLSNEKRAALELYEKMREDYVRGDFSAAHEKLARYRQMEPQDGLGELYEERINQLLEQPPESWDGVTGFETK